MIPRARVRARLRERAQAWLRRVGRGALALGRGWHSELLAAMFTVLLGGVVFVMPAVFMRPREQRPRVVTDADRAVECILAVEAQFLGRDDGTPGDIRAMLGACVAQAIEASR